MSEFTSGNGYMFPSATDVYDREKAIDYWLELAPDGFITSISMELLSDNGHAKFYLKFWEESKTKAQNMLLPDNEIRFRQMMQSICDNQPEVSYLLEVFYLYEANRRKKDELMQSGNVFTEAQMRFPDGIFEDYTDNLPEWYEKEPKEFLSIIAPIVERKISSIYDSIEKLAPELGLDRIVLSVTTLSNGEEIIVTLGRIINSLLATYSILKEEFFLVSSYAQACK